MIPSGPSPSQDPASLDAIVAGIADSETMKSAPAMRTLLLYLWQHRGEAVGQYAIAVDAMERPRSFDAKTDSTVRVQIARLRAKLKEYYEREGKDCPLKLSIPRGQHTLEWEVDSVPRVWRPVISVRHVAYAAVVVALAAIAGCLYLWSENRVLEASRPEPLPRFWRTFLAGGKPAHIIVPSPLFVFWSDQRIYMRDLTVSEFANWPSPTSALTVERWGQPAVAPIYVGVMELAAGLRVMQFLERRGQTVEMIPSRGFSAESFGNANTVFIGMPRTAVYLAPYLKRNNFYISQVSPDIVVNRDPRPGEPADFRQIDQSQDRSIHPAIIAVLPLRPEQKTRCIFLLGRILYGVTSILVTREGLAAVEEAWARAGSPDAWEMVIEADIQQSTVHKVRPVAIRAIDAGFWDRRNNP